MVADIAVRLKNLSKVVDRMLEGDSLLLHTDDPERPAYVTTHFDKDFACVQIINQAMGSTGVAHCHDAEAWVFLLEGDAELLRQGGEVTPMSPGQFHHIGSGCGHSVRSVTDTTYVLITMPSLMLELRRAVALDK